MMMIAAARHRRGFVSRLSSKASRLSMEVRDERSAMGSSIGADVPNPWCVGPDNLVRVPIINAYYQRVLILVIHLLYTIILMR